MRVTDRGIFSRRTLLSLGLCSDAAWYSVTQQALNDRSRPVADSTQLTCRRLDHGVDGSRPAAARGQVLLVPPPPYTRHPAPCYVRSQPADISRALPCMPNVDDERIVDRWRPVLQNLQTGAAAVDTRQRLLGTQHLVRDQLLTDNRRLSSSFFDSILPVPSADSWFIDHTFVFVENYTREIAFYRLQLWLMCVSAVL